MSSRTMHLAAFLLLAAAAALGQEGAPPADGPAGSEPRQIDVYGDLRHCDWTARLDNLASELQNDPNAKGFIVSYNAPGRHSYAPRQVRFARYYLTETRGIDASRLVLVEGGAREELKDGQTELWVVPEGAEPPVAPPAADRYAPDFSGKFDTLTDSPDVYQEMVEMGTPMTAIARVEFASKLQQQPESVGYVVIRAPRGGAPGAWRRFARRDEQLLRESGVEASRLKSLDGGAAEGQEVEIEFWILPASAPPPAVKGISREETFSATVKLHTFDTSQAGGDEGTERWMLENLAEFLREHPRATALLVAREPTPYEQTILGTDPAEEVTTGQAEAAPETAGVAAEEVAAEESPEPEQPEVTMREQAERWKSLLVGKYGVHADRIALAEGRRAGWPAGRINVWVIPEKGRRPDPSAADKDEAEREEFYGVAPERDAAKTDTVPPR